jgi:micrococcal nuclease
MKRKHKALLIFVIALIWTIFDQSKLPEEIELENYQVLKVIDGDTVSISINGEKETLRLIGVDTPETVHPNKPVECFGIEASNYAKDLLSNKIISVEYDQSQGEVDKYGRSLVYIFLPDGRNFNKIMIEEGYAYEYTYGEAYKYQKEFKESQIYAKENKLGLWADNICE